MMPNNLLTNRGQEQAIELEIDETSYIGEIYDGADEGQDFSDFSGIIEEVSATDSMFVDENDDKSGENLGADDPTVQDDDFFVKVRIYEAKKNQDAPRGGNGRRWELNSKRSQ